MNTRGNNMKKSLAVKKKNNTKKVSYSLDIDVLEKFNKIAETKGYNKSKTVNNLIRAFIEQENSLS